MYFHLTSRLYRLYRESTLYPSLLGKKAVSTGVCILLTIFVVILNQFVVLYYALVNWLKSKCISYFSDINY